MYHTYNLKPAMNQPPWSNQDSAQHDWKILQNITSFGLAVPPTSILQSLIVDTVDKWI